MCQRLLVSVALVLLVFLSATDPAGGRLVGWWKFDESTGAMAADSSDNGHHGTVSGTAAWVTGVFGGALLFNGTDTYVDCGVIPIATNGTGGLTVSAWINRSVAGDHKLCSNRQTDSAAGGGFTCAIYNNRMEMDLEDASGRLLSRDSARPTIAGPNTWVHVMWVYDDPADTLKLYVNGVLAATATVTQSIGLSTRAFRIGSDSPSLGHYFAGMVDDLRLYDHALTDNEIDPWNPPMLRAATGPEPAYKQTDVPRDVILTWKPGPTAQTHDVYFGTGFDDVNAATRANPRGVLVSGGQDASTYDPQGSLAFGQTYYWRVDEVNGAPDFTTFKGTVWSFTTEPAAYKVSNITATASSSWSTDMTPGKTVDGSGLNDQDQHGTVNTTMWLSASEPSAWIQYEFDRVYSLREMWVWNSNQSVEWVLGVGIKSVRVEYSTDGQSWTALPGVTEFAQAPGTETYTHNTTVDFQGAAAKFVKITALSSWAGRTQYGLSEVRFYYTPVFAREPQPANGQTGVNLEVTMSWRSGRNAVSHKVYFGTDPDALTLAATTAQTTYTPTSLTLGSTCYWRIDEVNEADAPPTWMGDVWAFTVAEYQTIDDFESYTDDPGNCIFDIWLDGWNSAENGSQVGNDTAPFAERTIVHSGRQSMPLKYDNSGAVSYSEAERTWSSPRDWTAGGADTLSLYFQGADLTGGNTPDTLYITVKDSAGRSVTMKNADPAAVNAVTWQQWSIPLSSLTGINTKAVKFFIIGVGDRTNPKHGVGKIFVDDIQVGHPAEQ